MRIFKTAFLAAVLLGGFFVPASSQNYIGSSQTIGPPGGNFLNLAGNTTGASPIISMSGVDTNIGMQFMTKGRLTPNVQFTDGSGSIIFQASTQPQGGNGAAANFVQTNPGQAGTGPSIGAVGADTNINVLLQAKGTGIIGSFNPIGYLSAGTVTQTTSRTTSVTLNNVAGAITLVSAAGSATAQVFSVSNTSVAATDVVICTVQAGTTDTYTAVATAIAANAFKIVVIDLTGTTVEQPVINFAIFKA